MVSVMQSAHRLNPPKRVGDAVQNKTTGPAGGCRLPQTRTKIEVSKVVMDCSVKVAIPELVLLL